MFFSEREDPCQAALDYARRTYPVFPMRAVPPDADGGHVGKRPLCPHGFKDACTEEAAVSKWWRDYPDALIAIPTGTASGLLVIDIDGENGMKSWKDLAARLDFDPFGTAAETSGSGWHLYYEFPCDGDRIVKTCDGWLDNVDLKAQLGSVVISPSRYSYEDADGNVVRKRYAPHEEYGSLMPAPLPDALRKVILALPCVGDETPGKGAEFQAAKATSDRGLRFLMAKCRDIENSTLDANGNRRTGRRNDTLYRCAAAVANYSAGGEIAIEDMRREVIKAARKTGLDEGEIYDVLERAIRDGFKTPKNFEGGSLGERRGFEVGPPDDGVPHPADDQQAREPSEADGKPVGVKLPDFPEQFVPKEVSAMMRNLSQAFNADMWMAFAGLLQAVSALVGAGVAFRYQSHVTTTHLWLALICESGSGKSSVMNAIFKPVQDLQFAYIEEFRNAYDDYRVALMEAERQAKQKETDVSEINWPEEPRIVKLFVENATFESMIPFFADNPQGLLWHHDELQSLIRSFGQYTQAKENPVRGYLLSLYNGGGITVDRKKDGKLSVAIPSAWVSLYGTVQGAVLPRLVTEEDMISGFLARFMFVCADRLPPRKGNSVVADYDLVRNVLKGMTNWKRRMPAKRPRNGQPGVPADPPVWAELTPEAQDELDRFYYDIEVQSYYFAEGSPLEREMQRGRAVRWRDQCSRLVLIMHCIERSVAQAPDGGGRIEVGTVKNAIGIFKCLIEHSKAAWDLAFADKGVTKATKRALRNEIAIAAYLEKYMRPLQKKSDEICFYYGLKDSEGVSLFDRLMQDMDMGSGNTVSRQALSASLKTIGFTVFRSNSGMAAKIKRDAFESLLAQNGARRAKEDGNGEDEGA